MKWGKPKREKYSSSYIISAKKSGYKANVCYSPQNSFSTREYFYFLCENNSKVYNSLWDNKAYKTEESARVACEKWIDEQVGGAE